MQGSLKTKPQLYFFPKDCRRKRDVPWLGCQGEELFTGAGGFWDEFFTWAQVGGGGGSWQSCPLGLRILEKSCPLGREVTGKRISLGRGSSLDDGEPASAMASLCLT